ncbi:MAG TPA: hypothetical protein VIV60_30945 [Polyangiaceae bacterium]
MKEHELDDNLRRIRTAIEGLTPSSELMEKLDGILARFTPEQSAWWVIASHSRVLAGASLTVIVMSALIGWRAEMYFARALAEVSCTVLEVLP